MSQRRAHRLRLRASSETALRKGVARLADALDGASLHDDIRRLFLVRRFSVGAFSTSVSSRQLERLVEERFDLLRARAVHGAAPSAASADIVWFYVDEAPSALASAVAVGSVPRAWFWPLALPGYTASLTRAGALGVALRAAASSPAAPAALALLVERAGALGDGALFSFLASEDGLGLLAVLGIEAESGRREPHDPALTRPLRPSPLTTVVERWVRRWSMRDPRSRWLAAVAALIETPALAANSSQLLARALGVLRSIEAGRGQASDPEPKPADPASDVAHPTPFVPELREAVDDHGPRAELASDSKPRADLPELALQASSETASTFESPDQRTPHVAARLIESDAAPSRVLDRSSHETPRHENELHSPTADGVSTDPASAVSSLQGTFLETKAGGLLFAIWMLRALGIEALLETRGDLAAQAFGARLLLALATQLRVPDDDPLLTVLAQLAPGATNASDLRTLLRSWIRACRRHCRLVVGTGLTNLVRRAGLIAGTPTHIDVVFPLRAADVRIRRAGLDCDPGWVPWLGRVVLFHYVEGGELPRW